MLRRYLISQGKIVRRSSVALLLSAATVVASAPLAQAFDDAEPSMRGNVAAIFKFGFFAEKKGNKGEAVEAYRDAARQGHKGARWKLANMYAAGDGVPEDDLEAFRIFQGIVNQGAEPGTQDASFVANALVSLSDYIRTGIPETPVVADPRRARELLWQAAANFGEPNAQFKLGDMFLMGEGGPADPRKAAQWFNLAAQKGHAGAQAKLGHLLFERGQTVRGLAYMTKALAVASPEDRAWIRRMQEDAFAVSSEVDRRTAIALTQTAAQ